MLTIESPQQVFWSSQSDALRILPVILVAKSKRNIPVAAKRIEFVAVYLFVCDVVMPPTFLVIVGIHSASFVVAGIGVVAIFVRYVRAQCSVLDRCSI